ncbi:MAG TPA: twin-arginine translocase subunit TatC [Gemmatimonas sp.]|nr:twin-arginine translocase subunit TatC [Gemmatimonas sp.]
MTGEPKHEMPFLEHLEELRWRLFKSALAIAITVGASFALIYSQAFDLIGILAKPALPYMKGTLIATRPSDIFEVYMDMSITLGLILASPVIVWQIWGFLSPALYGHEKKVIIPTLVGAAFLFLGGMALAFFFALPVTLKFLLGLQSDTVTSMLTVSAYFDFVFKICISFGAVFELPIVILLLTMLGIVTPAMLVKFRRHAFVGCIIAAAVITPGDAPTALLFLTVPLYFLYEGSIWLSRLVFSRREKRIARQESLELV